MCCSPTPLQNSPITHLNHLHVLHRQITIVWAKTTPHLDTPTSLCLYIGPPSPNFGRNLSSTLLRAARHVRPSRTRPPPPPATTPASPPPAWRPCPPPHLARSPCHRPPCNTPDVIYPICTPTLAVSGLKLFYFLGFGFFVSVCCYHCHASHIMSSCALHLHTCSSHAIEHFPRGPFCIPALRSPPVVISTFLSCV